MISKLPTILIKKATQKDRPVNPLSGTTCQKREINSLQPKILGKKV
jgi:hypothetical protein